MNEESEFGKGIVVCLAKFSEHLWDGGAFPERSIREFANWAEMTPDRQDQIRNEAARYPQGDAAQRMARLKGFNITDSPPDEAISRGIEMWANAASDHFYDLDERAPESLKELAAMTLEMGHGFTGQTYTMDDFKRVRELWKNSCLEVDKMLNVQPDWGAN